MNSQRGGFALGLIVGLLSGLALALAVALYINKEPAPFGNKVPYRGAEQDAAEVRRNKDWDPNAPLAGKNPARPAAATASGVVDAVVATSRATPGSPAASSVAGGAVPSAARGGRDPAAILGGQASASPARSTATGGDALVYFVQAGAYTRAEDAERQRARLALLGWDARVTEREQSGRTMYRVRLGPFERRDEAEGHQGRMAEANVDAALVRVER